MYHYNQLEITCDIPFRVCGIHVSLLFVIVITIRYFLFDIYYSLFTIFYSLFTIHRLLFTTAQYTIQLFTIHYSSPLSSPLVIIHHYFTNFRYSTIHYSLFTISLSLFYFFCIRKNELFFSMNMRSAEEFDDSFFVHRVSTIFFQFFPPINTRRLLRVVGWARPHQPVCSMHNGI